MNSRPPYHRRLLAELLETGEEHDLIVRLIIVEKAVKVLLVAGLVASLLILGRSGQLQALAAQARQELLVSDDLRLFRRVLEPVLTYVSGISRLDGLVVILVIYGAIEGAEGLGLYLRRRWGEYLTVLATGFLIPYEAYEVIRHVTPFKVVALIANVAIVAYLAWRKRLFVNV